MPTVITRRSAAAGLMATAAAARAARSDPTAQVDAARREASLTWYVAQLDTVTAERFGRAFTAEYPGITVEVIRTTGQVAFQRLLLDIKNHTPHCDVFSATDISHMPILKERHELTGFTPDNSIGMRAQFTAQSDAGWYYVTNAGRWVLIRNRDKVAADAAPKAWTDLLDPRWKGQVSVAHPAFSGGAGVWSLAMRKLYGWKFFEALAKNNPRVGRSTQDTVTLAERWRVPGRADLGAWRLSGRGQGQPDRHHPARRWGGGDGVPLRHSGRRAASECGEAVHGMDAEPGVFAADRGGRQRTDPLGRGAAAGRTSA